MSLLYISQQLTIYGGLLMLAIGIVGNGMNILIFSSIRNYRRTPSSFYFLVGSIINTLYILINLTTRIANGFYGVDLTNYSLVWCKTRNFSIGTLSLISLTCSCLVTIDQFFVTSRNARLRRCSSIKRSHRIVLITIIIWCLHGIPTLFYASIISPWNICAFSSPTFYDYILVYVVVLLCFLPAMIMIVFGCLTYRNIRQTIALVEQQADRQLVKMTLMQVVLVVISMVPIGVCSTYALITFKIVKSIDRQMRETLVAAVATIVSYLYYVGSFYMFLISSNRFRRTVKARLLWWRRPNQIYPTQT